MDKFFDYLEPDLPLTTIRELLRYIIRLVGAIGGDTPSRWFTIPGFEAAPASFGSDAPHLTNFEHRAICGAGSIRFAHRDDEHVLVRDLETAVEKDMELVRKLQHLEP